MSVSSPSRVKVAHIYLKRAVRWRRNTSPYISGDAFADLADFVYKPPKWRNLNRTKDLSNAKIIYCRSHELQELFDLCGNSIQAKVVITGNSDFEFHSKPKNVPISVKALFLQNSFISDNDSIFTIPIGLENFRLGVNGNPKFVKNNVRYIERKARILFGPLSDTHPIRKKVQMEFSVTNPCWQLIRERMSPKSYDRLSKTYGFIACIRGNGVDTHRLWESLYRGITPIVSRDVWWESLEKHYPEVKSVQDWNINEVIAIASSGISTFNPKLIDALWMPFWEKKIAQFLND